MTKIPGSSQVGRALKGAKKTVKTSLKGLNYQAAKQMAKGNYVGAEALVSLARQVGAFEKEVGALGARWKDVRTAAGGGNAERTPLWEYYRPILRALEKLGGRVALENVLPQVQVEMKDRFRDGDLRTATRGMPRWHADVRRARGHMIEQGFLEKAKDGEWRITPAGQQAAGEQ